mmetsp:Transcript_17804/g.46058  ORF Transcript_17804/g.46058 Transcript_17804/m.46058 type:complete len:105 (+) Transcript_17804:108-422(+)
MSEPTRSYSQTHPTLYYHFKQKGLEASCATAMRCSRWLPDEPYELEVPTGPRESKTMIVGAPDVKPTRDFGDGLGGPPSSKQNVAGFVGAQLEERVAALSADPI